MANNDVRISGRFLKIGRIEDEWFADLGDPEAFINELKGRKDRPDIFTFWQRLPDVEPRYEYFMEKEKIAVLELSTYDHWWKNQLNPKTRNVIRKSLKSGVEVRKEVFNDKFVQGIVNIFDETPVRQGRPFLHYHKGFKKVKAEMADRPEISQFIGAYWNGELIGFIKLLFVANYTMMVEIISKIAHRDKSPNNALISKAVEICCEKGVKRLVYSKWLEGTLGNFKRHNGFVKYELPRYFVPLTIQGNMMLSMGMHKGVQHLIPDSLMDKLKEARNWWYEKVK